MKFSVLLIFFQTPSSCSSAKFLNSASKMEHKGAVILKSLLIEVLHSSLAVDGGAG